jgi:hypothetical protein
MFTDSVGTSMVGACSKNGYFYALRANSLASGPVWSYQVGVSTDKDDGTGCLSAAVWDAAAHQLIIGSNQTSLGTPKQSYAGSIRALSTDAAPSRRVLWEMGLPCEVLGTPSEDAAGVLAVITFDTCSGATAAPRLYLFNARQTTSTPLGNPAPKTLTSVAIGPGGFAQPTFADRYLFASSFNTLTAFVGTGTGSTAGVNSPKVAKPRTRATSRRRTRTRALRTAGSRRRTHR